MICSFIEICREFPMALLCGCFLAISCSVFGVFVFMKRMIFISIAMSECSACGIAIASLCGVAPFAGASVITLLAVCMLACDWEKVRLPNDAILGALFVGASALSVLLVSHSGMGLLEVKALLYGDLLLVSPRELLFVIAIHLPLLVLFVFFSRPLLFTFLDRSGARVAGISVRALELGFFVALGLLISSSAKIAGSLLVFCYLLLPPMTGMLVSKKLSIVMLFAVFTGMLATVIGLTASFHWDLSGNQCIIVASCVITLIAAFAKFACGKLAKSHKEK